MLIWIVLLLAISGALACVAIACSIWLTEAYQDAHLWPDRDHAEEAKRIRLVAGRRQD